MTSAAVSNVAVTVQKPAAANAADTSKVTEEQGAAFQSLLKNPNPSDKSLTAQMNAPTAKADKDAGVSTADKPYDAISKRDAVKIDDATQPKTLTKEEKATADAAVKDFSEKVESVLEEELEVTEEEIAQAMETLGLTFLDLAQPEQLITLVAELTGTEESSELLMNQDLNGIMDQVSELVTNLTEEAGIPLEELTAMGMTEVDDNLTEGFQAILKEETVSSEGQSQIVAEETEPEGTIRSGEVSEEAVREEVPRDVTTRTEESEIDSEPIRTQAATATDSTRNDTETEDTASGDAGRDFSGTNTGEKTVKNESHEHAAAIQQQDTPQNVQEVPQENAAPRPVVDVQELLDQFAEFARTNITADTSSIEMRLNPENLGRLLINVQEQEGAVRATIQTQNAEVKEALESQIAILRTTLEGQGLKVTEVEVTVASHEFEENLEKGNTENAAGEQQEERREAEQNGGGTRRNLNINDLDSLQGLMSEEEALAAQIMRDNGNSVDYTA